MKVSDPRIRILLSVQRALIGAVFPALESLWMQIEPRKVHLMWCVDGRLSSEDRNSISIVEAEMQADFDEGVVIESELAPPGSAKRKAQAEYPSTKLVCVFERRST